MIVLLNFNSYIGGGETLLLRLAEYFQNKGIGFKVFYKKDSYIESDIVKKGICSNNCHAISLPVDYYYLKSQDRAALRNKILSSLEADVDYELYSFCARDLYLTIDLTKNMSYRIKIVHLILHDQDNLYCCQTLVDKIRLKLLGKRYFSSQKMIKFNETLFNIVNKKGVLIPQSDFIVKLWGEKFGIEMDYSQVVPLPACNFLEYNYNPTNNKKILWIGRIIDFKIPALCSLLNFLKRRSDYSLSIVGYGAEEYIRKYIADHHINIEQIRFLGKINYDELGNVISNHSIGYAMGTSIIEIAQYGIPVIMALASPSYHLFKKDACGGLYVNKSKGNVGVDLFYDENIDFFPTIDETINNIECNYLESAYLSYECIRKMFDFETNINAYVRLATENGFYTKYDITIPKANIVRRYLFNHYNK